VDPGLRLELEAAGWGWLDRSGHLRLVRGGLQIDRRLSNLIGPDTAPIDPLARPTGLAVAVCLLEGSGTDSVRGLATAAGVSTGAAHSGLTELATLGLLEEGQRRDPDLFWAVAARWSTRWYALRNGPGSDIPVSVQGLLRFGLDDDSAPGWAELGDRVAQAYGARVAGEGPPKIYLPDQRALTWALRTWAMTIEADPPGHRGPIIAADSGIVTRAQVVIPNAIRVQPASVRASELAGGSRGPAQPRRRQPTRRGFDRRAGRSR
jgi:hypothetical protein